VRKHDPVTTALGKDLKAVAASAAGRQGVLWTLEGSEDLNANLVRFGSGRGVEEHVNDEVDVVFVGVSGSGFIEVGGEERTLGAGVLVFVPKGARRSTRAASENFSYLTVHERRGPVRIGPRKGF
jgi:quercetin dioxygenase-like cupin family protein